MRRVNVAVLEDGGLVGAQYIPDGDEEGAINAEQEGHNPRTTREPVEIFDELKRDHGATMIRASPTQTISIVCAGQNELVKGPATVAIIKGV